MYNEEFEKIQVKIREAAYLHERVVELESLDSEHRERERERGLHIAIQID